MFVTAGPIAFTSPAQAHRDGCHAKHSCPSDTGSYVCGDLGYFSECGYTSIPEEPESDFDPPRRPVVASPKSQPKGKVSVTVTAESGSKLVVRSGGRLVYKATATGGPQVLTFQGLNGTRSYAVEATDSSGNTSSVAKFKATADSIAPSLADAVLEPGSAENAYATFAVAPGEVAKYVVVVDGRPAARGTLVAGANELSFPVPNGQHRVLIKLTDNVGNVSKLRQGLNVQIDELKPVFERTSNDNVETQTFSLRASPASVAFVRLGAMTRQIDLKSGSAAFSLDLPDGDYGPGIVSVTDQFGRKGAVDVPAFAVDTVKPTVRIDRNNDSSTTGRLVALIAAEKGTRVAWRVLDDDGDEIRTGSFVATGTDEVVDVDAAEGRAQLLVEATDDAGNVEQESLEANIAADPMTLGDWLILLVVLAVIAVTVVVVWVRHERIREWLQVQKHNRAVRAAQRAHDAALAAHAQQLSAHTDQVRRHRSQLASWSARKDSLTALLDEAQTMTGTAVEAGTSILGFKAKKGEMVFSVVGGTLVEQRTRQNVPVLVEVEHGRVAITNLRVLFESGSKRREWIFDKLEHLSEFRTDVTLMQVSNRKSLSGVGYVDPERTRVHLAIAMSVDAQDRHAVARKVGTILHAHIESRPAEPPPPPEAPMPPSLLLEAASSPRQPRT